MVGESLTACRPETLGTCEIERPSVMEKLKLKRAKVQLELNEIDKAIVMFEENPQLERAFTQLSRVGVYC